MTSNRINVSDRKIFNDERFLHEINFWLCQGFTTSLIGEINKVQSLVHAQKKSVHAYKQIILVKHATIDEALSITMHSLAGSTHDEISKDIVKWSLILC